MADCERDELDGAGFTLIELMVVVLIMGILMAIAIPTFLATRGSADNAAAESNVSNALINEKSYYTVNGAFEDLTNGAGAGSQAQVLDASLPWSGAAAVASGQVTAIAGTVSGGVFSPVSTAGATGPAVVIEAESASGYCMFAFDDEISVSDVVLAYAESNNSSGCAAVSDVPTSNPAPGSGRASDNVETGSTLAAADWYPSF